MNRIILMIILCSVTLTLFSQQLENDIINVNYEPKSVKKAVLLSAVLPGAGQFYVNPLGITTYIFPVLEIGLIAGMIYYNNEGLDTEKNYEKYANKEIIGYEEADGIEGDPIYRYNRSYFNLVKNNLIVASDNEFYNNHFNLDETNTQHFYEDIGKYNKYIFGWADWYDIYASDENGAWAEELNWLWFEEELGNKWAGNEPVDTNPSDINNYLMYEDIYEDTRGKYSQMRAEYIKQRMEAEDYYGKADLLSFGLVFNHILSALDAVRVTKNYNSEYISQNKIKVNIGPLFTATEIYPAIYFSKRF